MNECLKKIFVRASNLTSSPSSKKFLSAVLYLRVLPLDRKKLGYIFGYQELAGKNLEKWSQKEFVAKANSGNLFIQNSREPDKFL